MFVYNVYIFCIYMYVYIYTYIYRDMRICANVQQHINMIKMTTMVMTMIYSTQFNVAKIKQLS